MNREKLDVLDISELVVNIWWCGDHLKLCGGDCRIEFYSELCVESLKNRWQVEWGNFEEIANKIINNDKSFINDFNCLSADKQLIRDFLHYL